MHRLIRDFSTGAARSIPGWLLSEMENRTPASNRFQVLTYHRVDDPADPHRYNRVTVPLSQFQRQMQFLACNCHVISLQTLLEAVAGQSDLPPSSVLITFDDGYRDFADKAWPILRTLNLPVTLFVPTGFPDTDRFFWWDRLHHALYTTRHRKVDSPVGSLPLQNRRDRDLAFDRLRDCFKQATQSDVESQVEDLCKSLEIEEGGSEILGWPELKKLADQGVTLAPHTRNHPMLDQLSVEEATREALDSLEDLRNRIGPDIPPVLAYPAGRHLPGLGDALASAGFRLGFSTRRGSNRMDRLHPFDVRRINVGRSTTVKLLRTQLLLFPLLRH